jgi:hypothetical protein
VNEEQLEHLKSNLLTLQQGSLSGSEQTAVIHFAVALVRAHLHSHRTSYAHLLEKTGITEEDLAFDCVGNAFARNAQNEFIRIQQCLAKLSTPLEQTPAKEIFLLFKSFILRIADVHLARLFAMNDNAGANIKRNIVETLGRTNSFTLCRTFSGVTLVPSNIDTLNHLPQFPFDELERLFLFSLDGKRSTVNLIATLHSLLVEQESCSRSLPLNTVVQLFKKGYTREMEYIVTYNDEDAETDFLFADEHITEFDLNDALNKVFNTVKEKLFTTYLLPGKLNKNEAEGMFCALRDWVEDGKESQEQLSLKEYFTSYVPMNDFLYGSRIAVRMDYLKKLVKDEFQSYFDENV